MPSKIVRYGPVSYRYLYAYGRSGAISQSGLEVFIAYPPSTVVQIYPVTSKGQPSRNCWIEIPVESIDDVVAALLAAKNTQEAA